MTERQRISAWLAVAFVAVLSAVITFSPQVPVPCTVVGYGPGGVPMKSHSCAFPDTMHDFGPSLLPALLTFLVVIAAGLLVELAMRRRLRAHRGNAA